MPITTRQELKDYCLRRLGYPVIEINVDEDQVEDRIQDAIEFWNEYHFDGVERMYLKAQIEASTIKLNSLFAFQFQEEELITGQTSGATATVYKITSAVDIKLRKVRGTFVNGETVVGNKSGTSAVLANVNAFTLGSWDSGEFPVGDAVTGVIRIFNIGSSGSSRSSTNIFDLQYQFRLNDMYHLLSSDMIYYQQVKMHLQLLDDLFAGSRSIRFNRKQNKISLDLNSAEVFMDGDYVIFEVFRALDPEQYAEIYNDIFLKRYATALIKRQWGTNLKKFGGMQLPGGVVMNGQIIFDEADAEIKELEMEMQSRYELPVDFFTG